MKKRRLTRIIKNGLLYISLIIAIVVFVISSMHFAITNPFVTMSLIVSGAYILTFVAVNEVE